MFLILNLMKKTFVGDPPWDRNALRSGFVPGNGRVFHLKPHIRHPCDKVAGSFAGGRETGREVGAGDYTLFFHLILFNNFS